jgi:hypothetical protein
MTKLDRKYRVGERVWYGSREVEVIYLFPSLDEEGRQWFKVRSLRNRYDITVVSNDAVDPLPTLDELAKYVLEYAEELGRELCDKEC